MGKKIISLLAVFILLMGLMAAGCGKKENKATDVPEGKNTAAESGSAGSGQGESGPGQEKAGSGLYNGQIDGNSVEIRFNGEDKAFRLSEEVKTEFEGIALKSGDNLTFKYYEDQYGRLVITSLAKALKG